MKAFLSAALALSLQAGLAAEANPELKLVSRLESGPCIDLALHKGVLWTIGDGGLQAIDVSNPRHPRPLGRMENLGNVRQIACVNDVAYVVARDDGLYLIDISNPHSPALLYHYDTLEKATGISVAFPLAAVANRYHGVELIDVSNPRAPRYLATALPTKEVQSVEIQGNFLYAGAWADREVAIVDVSDPTRPRPAGKAALDGYGDGVRVRDGLCFAATGHHAAAFKKPHTQRPAAGDSGYGEGHGLEIFSVANPAQPELLARLKTPAFYEGYPDMWNVDVSGKFAILADTYNGVFLINAGNPRDPRFAGQARLPEVEGKSEPVAAVAAGRDVIYAAGYRSGLFLFEAPGLTPENEPAPGPSLPAHSPPPLISEEGDGLRYRPEGQVKGIALLGKNRAALAVGNGGIHIVELDPKFRVLSETKAEGIVADVAVRGDTLFAAETTAGLSAWTIRGDGKLELLGRHSPPGASFQQVVVSEKHPFALVENGQYLFDVLEISNPSSMLPVLSEKGPGLFYGKWIAPLISDEGLAAVSWNMGGPVWFALSAPAPKRITNVQSVVGNVTSGSWMFPDGRLLVLHGNGLSILPAGEAPQLSMPQGTLPEGEALNGIPSADGSTLFSAASAWRVVKAVDISDPANPRLLEKWQTRGNPSRVAVWGDSVLVPEGRGGLVIQRKSYLKSSP